MCAAVEVVHADDAAGKTGDGDMITAELEAAQLFHDDGRQRGFTPGVVARLMPGLRDQRKIRQFCDVVFQAADGSEIWAHRLVLAANTTATTISLGTTNHARPRGARRREQVPVVLAVHRLSSRYSGCYVLFTLAEEGVNPEQKRKNESIPPIRVVVEDLNNEMIKLLVDFAYHVPLHEHIGLHNVGNVLELAEKLKLIRIRDHCLNTLKQNLEPESCVDTYHLASRCGYENLAGESFRYLLRNFGEGLRESHHQRTSPGGWRQPGGAERDSSDAVPAIHGCWRSCRPRPVPKTVAHASLAQGHPVPFRRLDDGHYQQDAHVQLPHGQMARDGQPEHPAQGHIYAMGGFDGRARLKTVERYDVKKNRWSMVADMNEVRSDASAAAACGRIYIAGGFTGEVTLNTVECYDPSTDAWTMVLTMPSPRRGLKAVAHKNMIYLIGGVDFMGQLSSMTLLDIRRARVSDLPGIPLTKGNFGAAVLEGHIYAIGGHTGSSVARYDIEAGKWDLAPAIDTKCSAAAAFVVRDVGNVEAWI
ncbi:kelch-like protein diablo [Dermacentor variabilis]|uniref:kelch-like protein diablo n=1 Tax=Dermacentor variabilis TaxID=34621 RepID=UPI003F5BC58F